MTEYKMQPLATNQRMLTLLCICPCLNRRKRRIFIAFNAFLVITELCGLLSSIIFVLKHLSHDLENAMYALFQVLGFIGLTYMIIVANILREKITGFLETMSKICEASVKEESFRFLVDANDKSEWMWQFYYKFIVGGFCVSTISLSAISVLFCHLTNREFNLKYLYFPYRIATPWNQRSTLGYWTTICFDILIGESYFIWNGSIMLLFISICWYHEGFYKQFQDSTLKLDQLERRSKAEEILCELIQFHNSIKAWFRETSEVYSFYILIQLIYSVVLLASAFLQLDLQLQHIDISLIIILIVVSVGAFNTFLYCYFGKLATESYEKMADSLFQCKWLELPVHLQKYLVLMIGNAHRPLYYHGFGLAVLRLETFASMLRITFTYYMMFKTITSR